jgi:hypothetical protein
MSGQQRCGVCKFRITAGSLLSEFQFTLGPVKRIVDPIAFRLHVAAANIAIRQRQLTFDFVVANDGNSSREAG